MTTEQMEALGIEQTPPPSAASLELEAARTEASRFGWKPQEDWTGAPEAWVDADKFLARGKDYNGYLKKQNEALQGQIDELRDTLTAFQDHHTKVAQKAYEKALSDLKTSRKQALREGNLELVAELEDHIEQAQAEVPAATKQQATTNTPDPTVARVFRQWVSENPWFEQNESARILADGVGRKWQGKLVGREFLDRVADEVRAAMPTLFENSARRVPAAVDGGRENGASKGKHSYSDLPAEAKKECDRLTKRLMADGKPVLTREQYLKEYFEEGEE
jgi:gas vesicle protein